MNQDEQTQFMIERFNKKDDEVASLRTQLADATARAERAERERDEARRANFAGIAVGAIAMESDVLAMYDRIQRLEQERDEARARLAEARHDVVLAAKDLPVPIPEPGTDMSRLLIANVTLRRELGDTRASLTKVRADLQTMIAVHDEVEKRAEQAESYLRRFVKYVIEDAATTRGATRLARLTEEVAAKYSEPPDGCGGGDE